MNSKLKPKLCEICRVKGAGRLLGRQSYGQARATWYCGICDWLHRSKERFTDANRFVLFGVVVREAQGGSHDVLGRFKTAYSESLRDIVEQFTKSAGPLEVAFQIFDAERIEFFDLNSERWELTKVEMQEGCIW